MSPIRKWFADLPLWGCFIFFLVAWGAPMLIIQRLLYPDRSMVADFSIWPLAGLAFAATMTAFTARTRRRAAKPDLDFSVTMALRDDSLPVGATWDAWSPVLLRRRAIARNTLIWGSVLYPALAAVSVVLAISSDGGQRVLGIVLAPIFTAVAILSALSSRASMRSCDALLDRLREDPHR